MTSQEFHVAIDLELDKTMDYEYPYIQPEEKDYWLNKAQDRIISQKLFGNNIKKIAYDDSLERIDDIKTLVRDINITGVPYTVNLASNMVQFTLPIDYRYYLRSFVNVDKIMRSGYQSTQTPFPVDIVSKDYLSNYLTIEGVNKPDINRLKGFIEQNKLVIVHDSYTTNANTCMLMYIKEPVKFDYTLDQVTDLPEYVHRQIIDETVLLLLANFESQRVTVEAELNSKSE